MLTMTYPTRLDARVAAENAVNTVANTLWPEVVTVLRLFEGCKVLNADGRLSKKVRAALPDPASPAAHGWYDVSMYNLWLKLRVLRDSDVGAHYAERSCFLGEIQNGVLVKVATTEPLCVTYDATIVRAIRQELAKAKAEVRRIEGQLFPFGEYDR